MTASATVKAGAIALAAVATIAGCGGTAEPTQPLGIPKPAELASVPAPQPDTEALRRDARAQAERELERARGPRSFKVGPLVRIERRALRRLRELREQQQRDERLAEAASLRATVSAVRDLTDAVLVAAGLEFATFDVLEGGAEVAVNVPKSDACSLRPEDSRHLSDRIVDSSNVVERVTFRLADGRPLGDYLKTSCPGEVKPVGSGPVVLSEAGAGFDETKPFRIRRSGATIEWTSASGLLQVYLHKDGKLRSVAVDERGRGNGTVRLSTTGTFTLRIAATAGWRLTVRDGVPPAPPTVKPKAPPSSKP